MLIPVWIGLAPVWYEWYSDSGNGLILKCCTMKSRHGSMEKSDGLMKINVSFSIISYYIDNSTNGEISKV